MHSRIAGTGSYLPAHILTNDELAKRVDTSDAWIRARTGIRERRIAAPDEKTSDLAAHAARAALAAAGIAPADVDLIIVATTTPDMVFPSTATIVQAKLGAVGGPAFDVQAVCSGFVYALAIADRMVASGMAKNALVIGAEIYSRILDWNDRGSCVLFGDGAGAVVLVPSAVPGIGSAHLHADGRYRDILCVPGTLADGAVSGTPFVRMDGPAVFKFAVGVMAEVGAEALKANGVDAERRRLAHPAPGEHPDHGGVCEEARRAVGADDRHRRPACEHVGRVDPAGARRGGPRRTHPARPPPAADRRRRRIRVGIGLPHLALSWQ